MTRTEHMLCNFLKSSSNFLLYTAVNYTWRIHLKSHVQVVHLWKVNFQLAEPEVKTSLKKLENTELIMMYWVILFYCTIKLTWLHLSAICHSSLSCPDFINSTGPDWAEFLFCRQVTCLINILLSVLVSLNLIVWHFKIVYFESSWVAEIKMHCLFSVSCLWHLTETVFMLCSPCLIRSVPRPTQWGCRSEEKLLQYWQLSQLTWIWTVFCLKIIILVNDPVVKWWLDLPMLNYSLRKLWDTCRRLFFVRLDDGSEICEVIVPFQKENLSDTGMVIDPCCFNEKAPRCMLLCQKSFQKTKPKLSNTAKQSGYECGFGMWMGAVVSEIANNYHVSLYHL